MKSSSQITRRALLKQAAAAGVGAVVLPQIVPSSVFGADAPSKKLNIGLLACGGRARDDMRECLGSENLVAICDVDQRQVAEVKKELAQRGVAGKAKVYEDYRKLLDEEKSVDAVVIAPGQRWHVPMSKRAMLAGKHVFCEKPLAHSCAQAREIRELAKQLPNLATQVGSQGGSTDTFRRSMEVIQAGVLGQIREVHVWMDRGCEPQQNLRREGRPDSPGAELGLLVRPVEGLAVQEPLPRLLSELGPVAGVRRRPPGRHGRARAEPAVAGAEARRGSELLDQGS